MCKKFSSLRWLLLLCLIAVLSACGGSSTSTSPGGGGGGGGGGDTPLAGPPATPAELPSNLASLVEKAGGALTNNFQASKFSSDLSVFPAVSYVTPISRFNTYVTTNSGSILTDVFGPKDNTGSVETNIRNVIGDVASRIEDLRRIDNAFTCHNTLKLSNGATIPVAFYGNIANGPSTNRYFDCRYSPSSSQTDIYGRDADDVLRIVSMSKKTLANTRLVERRGTNSDRYIVTYTTYHETATATGTTVFLDIQYVTANLITGPDNSFASKADNGYFRVRGRIVGRVLFDRNDTVTTGRGEFKVTADNVEPNNFGGNYINKYIGRGGFQPGEISIFNVNSNYDVSTTADAGTYCIQANSTAGGIPASIDATNCSAYEAAMAWGDASIPFTPDPALQIKFEDITFFPANNTDMIADDGSNFSIPSY